MTSFSPDDIDNFASKLHDLLETRFPINDDSDFNVIWDFCHQNLDKFCTRDRNYN